MRKLYEANHGDRHGEITAMINNSLKQHRDTCTKDGTLNQSLHPRGWQTRGKRVDFGFIRCSSPVHQTPWLPTKNYWASWAVISNQRVSIKQHVGFLPHIAFRGVESTPIVAGW